MGPSINFNKAATYIPLDTELQKLVNVWNKVQQWQCEGQFNPTYPTNYLHFFGFIVTHLFT